MEENTAYLTKLGYQVRGGTFCEKFLLLVIVGRAENNGWILAGQDDWSN